MRIVCAIVTVIAACAAVAHAQSAVHEQTGNETPAVRNVLAADESRRQAMLQGDVRALDSLLADDVTIVWGDGTTDNKAATLELFRSGRLRYQQSDYENTRVRLFGDIAIITGDARVKAVSDGESIAHLVRVTRVYALRQDRWQLVSVQTTRAATSSGASLTGKMEMYNPLLGNPWTCTHQFGNQPPQKDAGTVTFVIAPQNVLEIVISGPDFAARNFIGFDAKSNQYWRTEMGVFGGILRETSNDGVNFSGLNLGGPQARGTAPFPIRSVMTAPPDGKSSDLAEVFPETNATLTHHCAR
jgi:ketosteroid isomerase-like protein